MNQYPEDHPLWQDINFCPDWLYRHIREPPGAAVNQRVPQQHTVPAEGETAPSASRERQLAEGAEPAWNPRPAERQQEQQQCPTPRHDHQHPGTQHGHRPGSYGGGANVQPGGLEMALSREQFQQLYGAGGARTVPPAAQQHAEPQMHFQGQDWPRQDPRHGQLMGGYMDPQAPSRGGSQSLGDHPAAGAAVHGQDGGSHAQRPAL